MLPTIYIGLLIYKGSRLSMDVQGVTFGLKTAEIPGILAQGSFFETKSGSEFPVPSGQMGQGIALPNFFWIPFQVD